MSEAKSQVGTKELVKGKLYLFVQRETKHFYNNTKMSTLYQVKDALKNICKYLKGQVENYAK